MNRLGLESFLIATLHYKKRKPAANLGDGLSWLAAGLTYSFALGGGKTNLVGSYFGKYVFGRLEGRLIPT